MNRRVFTIKKSALSIPYGVFMAIFIIVPLIILILYAFSEKGDYSELTFSWTLDNFKEIFNAANGKMLWRSFYVGIISTGICLAVGYPVAYLLATSKYNKSKIFVMLFIMPMWINFMLRTLSTKALFSFLGLEFGMGAVIFGTVYNFLPFAILPIYNVISKIDKSLIEAANDLGATNNKTFLKVVLPLSVPGVISGVIMTFTPSITTFFIADMMSNKNIWLIGNFIDVNVSQMYYNVASAMSLVILVIVALSIMLMRTFDKENETQGGGLW